MFAWGCFANDCTHSIMALKCVRISCVSVRLLASIRIALRYLSEKSLILPRDTCRETIQHGQNMPRARTVP